MIANLLLLCKKRKSKASDVNADDIQAELARLRAENAELARLRTENARLSKLESELRASTMSNTRLSKLESELRARTISNTGVTQIVQELSISNATALCEAMPTLLPYLKGSEMRLGLVCKDLLKAVRDDNINSEKGFLPIQDPTAYLASRELTVCALDEMGLQSAMVKIPDDETYTYRFSNRSTADVLKLKKNKRIIMYLLENGCTDAAKEMINRRLIDFSVIIDIDRVRDTTLTETIRDEFPMTIAAAYGHLEMMKEICTIYPNNEMFDNATYFYAAKYGYLDIIEWLRSIDVEWDEDVIRGAARGGQTEIIRYLKSEGAPMNEDACQAAANNGHLEALQALREGPNPCPWDKRAFEFAVCKNH